MNKFIALFKEDSSSNKMNLKNSNNYKSPVSNGRDKDKDKDKNKHKEHKDKEHKDKSDKITEKEDNYLARFTDKEKDEIIATLKICTMKHKTLAEREEEFMTMCFSNGVSDEDAEAAKEIFLYREPDKWEMNILALEKGEWATSMATENFKRWRKVRPVLRTDSLFFKKDGASPSGSPGTSPAPSPTPARKDTKNETEKPPLPPRDSRHSNRW